MENRSAESLIVAGDLPVEKAPELEPVRQALAEEFAARFVSTTEQAILAEAGAAAQDGGAVTAVVVPWTPHPLVTSAVLDRLPHLKLIVATYGGIKRNVAASDALSRGIRLTCTGAQRARSVAEFTLALIMDGLLSVSRTHHDMKSGERFPRYGYTRELTGRTVGIVGYGAVTQELLRLLAPFGNDVLIHSKHAAQDELAAHEARPASLEQLLAESEVVVLATGLTDETRHIIDAKALHAMRPDALLVNTARGKLVDEWALVEALRAGRIRAALDVYEEEPLALDSPLRTLDNVTLTAHSANSTREMDIGRWRFALAELRGFRAGGMLSGELTGDHIARMSDD